MKITIYELIGMIKDGKAPKRIIYDKSTYWYNGLEKDYYKYTTKDFNDEDIEYLFDYKITEILNDTVEILEEEKKIPEKLESYISCGWNGTCKDLKRDELFEDLKKIGNKINEIIDYLKSKGE